jgi:hypothetical protein
MHWSGSIPVIEAMTRELEKSCQKENAACATQTKARTIARAKLATAGGSPRGFQAMKTSIHATKRMAPKPPKR